MVLDGKLKFTKDPRLTDEGRIIRNSKKKHKKQHSSSDDSDSSSSSSSSESVEGVSGEAEDPT